jgi:hypothetical protein
MQGILVRIHLYEFDYDVVGYEIWIISNKLMKGHWNMTVMLQSET